MSECNFVELIHRYAYHAAITASVWLLVFSQVPESVPRNSLTFCVV